MLGRTLVRLVPVLPVALASACGGGGGGGGGGSEAVNGLQPPGQVSVVTSSQGGSAASVAPGSSPELPPGSDWYADETSVYVYDPSIEPLATINMILCFVADARAGDLVNEGAYKAQMNVTKCDDGNGDDGGKGKSSGGADEFEIWTIESTRTSNDAPQTVRMWVPDDEMMEGGAIHVKLVQTAEPGPGAPFGAFELDFAGVPPGGSEDDPFMVGALQTNEDSELAGFEFYMAEGDVTAVPEPGEFAMLVQVNVQMTADQSTGTAKVYFAHRENWDGFDSGILEGDYLVAFDETHFLRAKDGGPAKAYSRNDTQQHVWSYNLYHASGEKAGQRVERESGFGFRTADDDYGWLGYWGLWVDGGVELESGDLIIRQEYGSDDETEYELVLAPGKLIRHQRQSLDLAAAEGELFQWWEHGDGGPGTNWLVEHTAGLWVKTAWYDEEEDEWVASDPQVIDTAEMGVLNLWSSSLGGSVVYKHGDPALTLFEESFVNAGNDLFAGTTQIELFGYVDQLASGITGPEAEAGDVFLPPATDVGAPYRFVFDAGDLTLYRDVDGLGTLEAVGLGDGEAPSTGPYTWGMHSGALLTSTSGLSSVWDAWSQDVFYTYETGHNPWNRYAAAKELSGTPVVFDPPLSIVYEHSTENDRNGSATYDGKTFLLQYGGPGDLWGLPSEAQDVDGDGEPDRWYPVTSLADGVVLGPSGEYVVKAIEAEETLNEVPSYDGDLTLDDAAALVLPDESAYDAPGLGEKPAVSGPPRVVDGVIVGGQ